MDTNTNIYHPYLPLADCKFYCKEVAARNNLSIYDYFYDNYTDLKFPGNSDIYKFEAFRYYERWRIKFKLTKPKTIQKMGLDAYVLKHKELRFSITIRGYQFFYTCKFYSTDHNET